MRGQYKYKQKPQPQLHNIYYEYWEFILDPSQVVSMAVGSGHRTDSPQGNLNDFTCQSRKWEISLMIRYDNHYHAIQRDIRNPPIFNIIRWFSGTLGHRTHRPSVSCSKYYFLFTISCKILRAPSP